MSARRVGRYLYDMDRTSECGAWTEVEVEVEVRREEDEEATEARRRTAGKPM